MDNYHEIDGDGDKGIVEILKDAYSNPKKRKFYNTMLQKADLNILEYRPVVEDRIVPNDFRERIQKENIPEEIKDVLLKPTSDSITFLNHSDNGDFNIPLRWQSKGTQKYIRILDALYDMITSPHVYYLDELGEDLHNDLLYYYLNVFIFNSDKSQLVITSQETTLLSQDMINENRGVVWFVEKNKETASSEYARGDSFGLHKNLSLYNSYRIGRLGAKPELGSIFINLEADMGKLRQTALILGEGPTEFFYFKSLCDVFKRLTIKPDYPKHTNIKELEAKIAEGVEMGYSHIFCIIDMDTKDKEPEHSQYHKLKVKYAKPIDKSK